MPGLRVLAGKQEMDALYDELSELLGKPDALDSESETAKQIAEVEARLERFQQAEADIMRAAFEARLPVPLDEIATFNEELADVLARARARAADDDPASDS